jgi:hypothetical protein
MSLIEKIERLVVERVKVVYEETREPPGEPLSPGEIKEVLESNEKKINNLIFKIAFILQLKIVEHDEELTCNNEILDAIICKALDFGDFYNNVEMIEESWNE